MAHRFDAELWKYPGKSGWHFVTLPLDLADEIEERTAEHRRGFGSVRVRARIGTTRFDSSIFPDTRAQSYVLPVKQQVRAAEGITAGQPVTVHLEIAEPGA